MEIALQYIVLPYLPLKIFGRWKEIIHSRNYVKIFMLRCIIIEAHMSTDVTDLV